MQAAAQKHVDSSISKTINCPEDISFEDFCEVYMAAWDAGCKGCTTYRPNDVTGSILSVTEAPAAAAETSVIIETDMELDLDFMASVLDENAGKITHLEPGTEIKVPEEPAVRPEELEGRSYKLKWPGSNHALYITINDIEEDGKLRPFEIFINSKNMEHFAWTVALTRMISAVFRRPHDSTFIVDELKAVFDPKGGAWMDGAYIPSILAAIGGVIEKHMKAIGYIPDPFKAFAQTALMDGVMTEAQARRIAMPQTMTAPYGQQQPAPAMCPACHSSNVKKEAGCFVCKDCGNSNCG
jgi:ribonucleoside-diphosphate reductase alpha chain